LPLIFVYVIAFISLLTLVITSQTLWLFHHFFTIKKPPMGLGFISHPDKLIYDPPFLIKDQYLYNFVKGPKPFPFSNRLKSLYFGVNVEPKLFRNSQ